MATREERLANRNRRKQSQQEQILRLNVDTAPDDAFREQQVQDSDQEAIKIDRLIQQKLLDDEQINGNKKKIFHEWNGQNLDIQTLEYVLKGSLNAHHVQHLLKRYPNKNDLLSFGKLSLKCIYYVFNPETDNEAAYIINSLRGGYKIIWERYINAIIRVRGYKKTEIQEILKKNTISVYDNRNKLLHIKSLKDLLYSNFHINMHVLNSIEIQTNSNSQSVNANQSNPSNITNNNEQKGWKQLSFPSIHTSSTFKLAKGCNHDWFLGVEIFHYTQPGFKIHEYNLKLDQWEVKAEFPYQKLFSKGIIINPQTGMLYVPIEGGTQLLHIELHNYKIVKRVQMPKEMWADHKKSNGSPRLSRTTTTIFDCNGISLLYLFGNKGHLFLYHINKNIITQKKLKFYPKNARITFIGACHGQNIDILDIDTFTSNNIHKMPRKFKCVTSCKIFHNDTLIFGGKNEKKYVMNDNEYLAGNYIRWRETKTVCCWTKYIYSMKQNKCNKIEFPMPSDKDDTDFDVVSFGLSANIVPVILKQTFGDLLRACPTDIICEIILFTADECVYFMDYTHEEHFKIETIKIMDEYKS